MAELDFTSWKVGSDGKTLLDEILISGFENRTFVDKRPDESVRTAIPFPTQVQATAG
jgi:hypothetical protein